jgi:hypothetical protein
MSNLPISEFSRMARLVARRFGWTCAGVLAIVGITPANAAVPQPPSDQSVRVNSIPERLRIIRERLGTEEPQNINRNKPVVRFTQWYKGR